MSIQKVVSLLNLFSFFIVSISPGIAGPLNRKELSVESVNSDRSSILTAKRKGRADKKFYEYSLPDQGFSSVFRIFGLNRQEAIGLVEKNLTNEHVKKFVANSIRNETFQRFHHIFKQYKVAGSNFPHAFSLNEKNQKTYLHYLKTNTCPIDIEENCDQEGNPLEKKNTYYGLINALACIQKKSLFIYTPTHKENHIRLGHSFYLQKSQECINAICRGEHFGFLAPIDDKLAQKLARVKQELETPLGQEQQEEDQVDPLRPDQPLASQRIKTEKTSPPRKESEAEGTQRRIPPRHQREIEEELETPLGQEQQVEDQVDPLRPDQPRASRRIKTEEIFSPREEPEPERTQRPIPLRYQREIEEAVSLAIPDRSSPLSVIGNHSLFYPYYTSGEGNNCGFRIFGFERAAALQRLIDSVNDEFVLKCIANTIREEPEARFSQIFGRSKEGINDLVEFSRERSHLLQYLRFLKTDRSELEIAQNYQDDGNGGSRFDHRHLSMDRDSELLLINALAYLQNKSLYIYKKSRTSGVLELWHKFHVMRSQERINACYNGHHYTLLAPANSRRAKEKGQAHELKNLEILRQQLLLEIETEEAAGHWDQPSPVPNPQRSPQLSSDEDSANNPEQSNAIGRFWHRIKKEEIREEEEENEAQIDRFFPEDYVNFINRRIGVRCLPGVSYAESLRLSHNYCVNQIRELTSRQNSRQFDDEHIPYLFGMARLMLEFGYYPNPRARDRHAETLLGQLKKIIRTFRKSRESKLRRYANYARIYAGKVLMTLNRFDDAYKKFMAVKSGYTKTYLIDIAQMIIEYGYRPDVIGNDQDPIDYAKSLLEQAKSPLNQGMARLPSHQVRSPREPRAEHDKLETALAHPAYVNDALTNNRRLHLTLLARERASSPASESRVEGRSRKRSGSAHESTRSNNLEIQERESLNSSRETSSSRASAPNNYSSSENSSRKRATSSHEEVGRSYKRRRPSRQETSESQGEETEEGSVNTSREASSSRTSAPNNYSSSENSSRKCATSSREEVGRSYKRRRPSLEETLEFQEEETVEGSVNTSREASSSKRIRRTVSSGSETEEDISTDNDENGSTLSLMPSREQQEFHRLLQLGYAIDNDDEARQNFEEALSISEALGDDSLKAQALLGLGNTWRSKNVSNEVKYFKEALRLAKTERVIIKAHVGLGNAREGNIEEHYQIALNLAKEIGDVRLQIQALFGLGAYIGYRNSRVGIEYYRKGLKLAKMSNDERQQAQAHLGLGDKGDGTSHFYVARELAQELHDKRLEVQALVGLGNAHVEGWFEYLSEALRLVASLDNNRLKFQVHFGLGRARIEGYQEHLFTALEIAEKMEDKTLQVLVLLKLAYIKDGKQIEYCKKAHKFSKELKDKELRARAHLAMAHVQGQDPESKINQYRKALRLAQESGNKDLEVKAYIGLGKVQKEHSIKFFKKALQIAEEMEDNFLQALTHLKLGKVHELNQEVRIQHHSRALALAVLLGDKGLEFEAYLALGNVHEVHEGDRREHLKTALKLAGDLKDKNLQAQVLVALGNLSSALHKTEEAQMYYQAAIDLKPSEYVMEQAQKGMENAYHFLKPDINSAETGLHFARERENKRLEAEIYLGLANDQVQDQPKQIESYKVALKLAAETKDKKMEALAHIGLGNANDKDRIEHYKEGLRLAKEINNNYIQAIAHLGLGNALAGMRKNKEALECYNAVLALNPPENIAKKAQKGRETVLTFLSKNINYTQKELERAQDAGDKFLQTLIYIRFGNDRKRNTQQVRGEYYQKALQLATELENEELQAMAHLGLGNIQEGNVKKQFKHALRLAKNCGSEYLQAQACLGLGRYYAANDQDQVAVEYFNQAIALKLDDKILQAQAHIGLGNAHEGVKHFHLALELAAQVNHQNPQAGVNLIDIQAKAFIGLGNEFSRIRNNREALGFYEKALSLNPSQNLVNKARTGKERVTRFLNQEDHSNRNPQPRYSPRTNHSHGNSSTKTRDRTERVRDSGRSDNSRDPTRNSGFSTKHPRSQERTLGERRFRDKSDRHTSWKPNW